MMAFFVGSYPYFSQNENEAARRGDLPYLVDDQSHCFRRSHHGRYWLDDPHLFLVEYGLFFETFFLLP
ncbi:MAG: hypothetical protein ABSD38_10790 [Syntrophorhabdales bacterium]